MSSSLFSSISTAAHALDVFQQAMGVVQNNVTNASTPGYVTQTLNLTANAYQVNTGLDGGVSASNTEDARNQFAEKSVWNQNQALGAAQAQSSSLSTLQSFFDVSGKSGIPAGLSSLYSAFSAWSSNPADSTAQTQVISAAQQVSQQFNQAASNIGQLETQTNQQLGSTVNQINQITSKIVAINVQIRNGGSNDPGLQAQLYNNLEQLSNYSTISVQIENDGTASVLMNGQIPLAIGTSQTKLQVAYPSSTGATNPSAPADAHILTSTGQDVTAQVGQGGQLGGLLQFRNQTLPSVIGSQTQQGSLNQLAQSVADRVNSLLTSGQVSSGPPAVPGVAMFTYTASSATTVASSLALTSGASGISASNLAAIQPGPPAVANGVASQLAQLADPTSSADMLNNMSYTSFYGSIAADIGSQASTASDNQTNETQMLNQAQSMRSQLSGVSLDQQAAKLQEYEQDYQASAQLITVVNSMTNTLMTMMQGA